MRTFAHFPTDDREHRLIYEENPTTQLEAFPQPESSETPEEAPDLETPENTEAAATEAAAKADRDAEGVMTDAIKPEEELAKDPALAEKVLTDEEVAKAKEAVGSALQGGADVVQQNVEAVAKDPNDLSTDLYENINGTLGYEDISVVKTGPTEYRLDAVGDPDRVNNIIMYATTHGLNPQILEDGSIQISVTGKEKGIGFVNKPAGEPPAPAEKKPEPSRDSGSGEERDITDEERAAGKKIEEEEAAKKKEKPKEEVKPAVENKEKPKEEEKPAVEKKEAAKEKNEKTDSELDAAEKTLENPDATEAEKQEARNLLTTAELDKLDREQAAVGEKKEKTETVKKPEEVKEVKEAKESDETDKELRSRLMAEVRNPKPMKTADGLKEEKEAAFKKLAEDPENGLNKQIDDAQKAVVDQDNKMDDLKTQINDLTQAMNGKKIDARADDQKKIDALNTQLAEEQTALVKLQQNHDTLMKNLDVARKNTDRDVKMLDTMEKEAVQLAQRTAIKFDDLGLKLLDLGEKDTAEMAQGIAVQHDESLGMKMDFVDARLHDKIDAFLSAEDKTLMDKNDYPVPALRGIAAYVKAVEGRKKK